MKHSTKPKPGRRPSARRTAVSVKGDIARAMFARWEKEHTDPKPVKWDEFKATLEANRLRETPLFSK